MHTKKLFLLLLPVMALLMTQAVQPPMKKIFNGVNLDGWVVPDSNNWWTVHDGILTARSGPDRKGSILWTEQSYQDFVFQTDFKMGEGTVDSGIFLRDEKLQIQIGISGSLKRDMTGAPYVPGLGYPVEAKGVDKLLRTDDWNTMKVQARGSSCKVWLNGQPVMTYTAHEVNETGPIGLQLHPGNEMSIDFRNIMVEEL